MGNRKQKLQKMKNEQFEKLTQNEAGQLKGGFRSLTAKIRTNIFENSTNCKSGGIGGIGDNNTNCGSCSCGGTTKPEKPIETVD